MIKQFDKVNLSVLRADINDALRGVALKHGIKITAGNATYNGPTATYKVECAVSEGAGFASKESVAFRRDAYLYGLKPEDLGRTFAANGTTYRIVGLKASAPKRPIVCETSDGRSFVFAAHAVARCLGHAPTGEPLRSVSSDVRAFLEQAEATGRKRLTDNSED